MPVFDSQTGEVTSSRSHKSSDCFQKTFKVVFFKVLIIKLNVRRPQLRRTLSHHVNKQPVDFQNKVLLILYL